MGSQTKTSIKTVLQIQTLQIIGPRKTFPEDLWYQSCLSVRAFVRPDDYGKSSERILMKFGI